MTTSELETVGTLEHSQIPSLFAPLWIQQPEVKLLDVMRSWDDPNFAAGMIHQDLKTGDPAQVVNASADFGSLFVETQLNKMNHCSFIYLRTE